MNPDWLGEAAAVALAAILAITLHEAAHGYAAKWLGDDTAARLGRLSLNPLRHVDLVGTLLLPGFLLVSQFLTMGRVEVMFGWAKPVPVAFWQLWNPRWGMVLVAAAGPAINFALALGFGLAAYQLRSNAGSFSLPVADWLWLFALKSLEINVIFACFNLLPVLPLDGGRILHGLLPASLARLFAATERYGLLIVIGVFFIVPLVFEGFRPLETFISFIAAPIVNALLIFTGLR